MFTVKHKLSLPIQNLDHVCEQKRKCQKHGDLFPSSLRTLICGPSNCGKSNVMLSMLFDKNGLKFQNVYVYSKSLYQPKYEFLKKVLKNIVNYFPYNENEAITNTEDAKEHSIFIFDDVACCSQEKIREYFAMGRHKLVDVFYLCQTYTRIPKHLIRDNANFLILFKQDDLNLKHIYQEHVGGDMSFDQFKLICSNCWNNKYDFLTIDKDSDINSGRYRKNFDNFIVINKQ